MKLLSNLIGVVGLTLIFFIVWMNLTPGYFQVTCYCDQVQYVTSEEMKTVDQMCATNKQTCVSNQFDNYRNTFLLTAAALDWNKK